MIVISVLERHVACVIWMGYQNVHTVTEQQLIQYFMNCNYDFTGQQSGAVVVGFLVLNVNCFKVLLQI